MAKAKAVMVQGTASNVGKSLLAAGLCRVLRQDGLRVAPFKSQNMALNSFVTPEGLEIGRAQAMQAEAAGIAPSARMNPILLKPTGDTGSQVIVMGEVRGNMGAAEYYKYKQALRAEVQAAYNALAEEVDVIVIEGAGSPAEINLRRDDFVNMGMAEMANAPVLLVGDIDRGGVFASLYGTVALFTPQERARVKGLVINKFRGDESILRPGLGQLEDLCGAPVLGVVPHTRLALDDEDSLASSLDVAAHGRPVDIAVVRLPHLSNFTDFDALADQPALGVRYVDAALVLGRPDLIILPGTKNTMDDLHWLHESGLAKAVQALAAGGTPVLGICGGYQMLGRAVRDPNGAESGGTAVGLGLLDMETVFANEKTRTRMAGTVTADTGFFACLNGCGVQGYEIHMGASAPLEGSAGQPFGTLGADAAEKRDGMVQGDVAGTYLHGLFDSGELPRRLATALLARRGLPDTAQTAVSRSAVKEREYDRLAAVLRAALDMELLYEIIGVGGLRP